MTRININLLGVERKESLERKGLSIDKGVLAAVGSVLAALLIVFIANGLLSNWIANAEAEKKANTDKIAELDAQIAEIKTLEEQRKDLLMEEKILLYVTSETYKWSYLLQEIRTLMPLDVSIKDLKFSADDVFTLTGTATDHRSVALFLVNSQNSKMLTGISLQSSTKAKEDAVTNFVITCKVNK